MSLNGRVPRISLILAGQMQLRLDFLDKFLRSRSQLDRQRALGRLRFFQIGELTSQQRRIHEVTTPAA